MRLARLELRRVAARGERTQGLLASLKGLVYFTFDPGERPDVEFGARCHC
jgi:hypothetical protein